MEDYLNKGIKEVILKFPEVGNILNEYNIGCVPCNVGTCLLKDIVQIHNLSPDREAELMAKISNVIYPGKKVKIPKAAKKEAARLKDIEYSPPVKKLVNEHKLIKRWVALIPQAIEKLDLGSKEDIDVIKNGVDFIRNYADKYHHAKEEDILFKYFDKDLDIIKAMHADHETAREHVKSILEALQRKDKKTIIEHLNAYKDLLTEHIKKEDEILYPWMDRGLSITQIGELFSEFTAIDEKFGDTPEHYKRFIVYLEERFK